MLVNLENGMKLDRITTKLEQLSETELDHAEKFLDALFTKEEKPFNHYLGKFLEINQEADLFTMKLGKQTENTYGVAQGGAVFSLADIAIGFYLIKQLPEEINVFTLELKMNFIKAGTGAYLRAVPSILHLGNTTSVTECEIFNDKEELVAKAFGTFYLKRPTI